MSDQTSVRTFLIADVRGYSHFTEQHGDEAAARLAAKFADLVGEGVAAHGGETVEIRGDEALAVFTSARQAIRAAVDLQAQFKEETEADSSLPLRVGIGIDSREAVNASPQAPTETEPTALAADAGLDALVPAALWEDCQLQTVPEPTAVETAVCLPSGGTPDRWEISMFPDGDALSASYAGELRRREGIERDKGKCNAFSWGGERTWLHGPDKPGGRTFCYFDGNDVVIVWTHGRLGQPTHRDVLAIAREGGSDHAGLTRWWRPWHHVIGKGA